MTGRANPHDQMLPIKSGKCDGRNSVDALIATHRRMRPHSAGGYRAQSAGIGMLAYRKNGPQPLVQCADKLVLPPRLTGEDMRLRSAAEFGDWVSISPFAAKIATAQK